MKIINDTGHVADTMVLNDNGVDIVNDMETAYLSFSEHFSPTQI